MSDALAMVPDQPKPWYAEGLNFECTGCGACCTGSPGYTFVTENEMMQMAAYLKLTVKEFSCRYLRRVGNRYSLVERRPHYDCVFLEGKRCQIYPVRPTQCRTFPFWPENVKSPEAWRETATRCEGIGCSAPNVSFAEVETQRQAQASAEI